MRYRTIPNTDLNPSVICLGALPFGISLSEEISYSLLDCFVSRGGTFIDTALVYGEWLPGGKGASESTVGRWVKARGNRQQLILGTKGAHPRLFSIQVPRLSREEITRDLEESLRNLQTEYIDIYWLHRDDPDRPVGEILDTLNEHVNTGKIRYFGCSNWELERIQDAQRWAKANEGRGFVANQLMWSLAVPNREGFDDPTMVIMDDATKRYHLASGMAAMAYNSQARGFFAKLQKVAVSELPQDLRAVYDNDENRRRATRLQQAAQERSLSVSVLALAYLTSQPFPTYPLSGASSVEQLLENLQAGEVVLDPGVVTYLESGR